MAKSVPERFIESVFAELCDTETAIGRRALAENNSNRRVVAIPLGAPTIALPDIHGDARYKNAGRQLLVRHFNIEWHCFDAPAGDVDPHFGASEDLYLKTIDAIRKMAHHSVEFSGETWTDQQDGGDGFSRFGSEIYFTSTILFPIYEERGVIVRLTANPPIVTTPTLNEEQP